MGAFAGSERGMPDPGARASFGGGVLWWGGGFGFFQAARRERFSCVWISRSQFRPAAATGVGVRRLGRLVSRRALRAGITTCLVRRWNRLVWAMRSTRALEPQATQIVGGLAGPVVDAEQR